MQQRNEQASAWQATAVAGQGKPEGLPAGVGPRADSIDLRGFDINAFVRREQSVEWVGRVGLFERVRELLHPSGADPLSALVSVRAMGRVQTVLGGAPRRLVDLQVKTQSALVCQSCLGPLDWAVDSAIVLELVDDESILGEFPDPDDPCEQVLASSRFDLATVIEDELLLCMPHFPRHEKCPGEQLSDQAEQSADKRPSPFAVLAQLKTDG